MEGLLEENCYDLVGEGGKEESENKGGEVLKRERGKRLWGRTHLHQFQK